MISNALPIQFWSRSETTYNEDDKCGLNDACWCQPVECDDLLLFYAPSEFVDPEYYFIAILDENGKYVYDAGFGAAGYHSLTPSSNNICDGQFQFIMYDSRDVYVQKVLQIDAYWANETNIWTKSTNYAEITATSGSIVQPITVPSGETIYFEMTVTISDGPGGPRAGNLVLLMSLDNGFGAEIVSKVVTIAATESSYVFSGYLTVPDPSSTITRLKVGYANTGGSFAPKVMFAMDVGALLYIPDDSRLYRSDCVDIQTSHECTELITYSNSSPFMGIDYGVSSPSLEFSLRVPIVLFHETFPREDEVAQLSDDSWLRQSSQLTRKVKAEFGYMTYYMIQKVNLIFMHDTVEIKGTEYVLNDAYEIDEGNRRYPLKKSSALLTDKNFIERNLI